jgi:hypothetical protein
MIEFYDYGAVKAAVIRSRDAKYQPPASYRRDPGYGSKTGDSGMINLHIGNRSGAITLIGELVIIADRCTNSCPISEKKDLVNGLLSLKEAIEKEE